MAKQITESIAPIESVGKAHILFVLSDGGGAQGPVSERLRVHVTTPVIRSDGRPSEASSQWMVQDASIEELSPGDAARLFALLQKVFAAHRRVATGD